MPSIKTHISCLVPLTFIAVGYLASTTGATPTTDNTCGGNKAYTCDPKNKYGGACCSSAGYCGNTPAYCGSGCQSGFGSCDISGVGRFNHFANFTFPGSRLPDGLFASDYTVEDTLSNPNAVFNHSFNPINTIVSGGFLTLKVPGGQKTDPIKCGEVSTTVSNILYASVRVRAILSSEPGVVNGFFFYQSDCQEIDIEYLPDPNSQSNPTGRKPPLQYTNQAVSCKQGDDTHTTTPAPVDANSALHEYRADWTRGKTAFYTDGVLQKSFGMNVPTLPGSWIFNIWTNGDPGFTVGPPKKDAFLKISNIVMYYNTTN